jgi:uncharacterized protein (DUF2235 family)
VDTRLTTGLPDLYSSLKKSVQVIFINYNPDKCTNKGGKQGMRNLVIAVDGTWNRPDQFDRGRLVPGNVVKMVRAVATDADVTNQLPQLKYYDSGVGTDGWYDKLWGGVAGRGLFGNLRQAYDWLTQNYQPDDRLFLFGFSRGAYTVRSLAAMLSLCGLPRDGDSHLAEQAATVYRIHDRDKRMQKAYQFRQQHKCLGVTVHFLGVWDTVGAMGLPTRGPVGYLTRKRHQFHNVCLSPNVMHARQALAINEQRAAFEPSLWMPPAPPSVISIRQLWFAGVHSNVGGGYVDAGLSDIALRWMMDEASAHGLLLNPSYVARRVDPDEFGELRDSLTPLYRTPMAGGLPRLRVIGSGALGEEIHESVYRRWHSPSRPDQMPDNCRL